MAELTKQQFETTAVEILTDMGFSTKLAQAITGMTEQLEESKVRQKARQDTINKEGE